MQIRNRYYPYPVIMEGGDYYEGSSFASTVKQTTEGYNIKLTISVQLNDAEMHSLIDSKKLVYVHHLECPQTCFRKAIKTYDEQTEILLLDKDINGELQVCSFVVADKDIEKYTNDSFSSDYRGWKFNIEKGCVMAIGNQYNLKIRKQKDDLSNTSSIFSVVKNLDPNAVNMTIDLGTEKIEISLPEITYNQYTSTKNYTDIQPAMHSMIIIPALLKTFSELQKAGDQMYEYEDCRWFRGLKKACESMNIVLDAESVKTIDIVKVSQQLMNNPISKAVEVCSIGGESYED